jgi:hypothetical protein
LSAVSGNVEVVRTIAVAAQFDDVANAARATGAAGW